MSKHPTADEPAPQTTEEPEPEVEPASSEGHQNGGLVESPTPNSHVVGVTIIEGSGDPQTVEPTKG